MLTGPSGPVGKDETMAITITAYATKVGKSYKGINFSSYLANYSKTYDADGRGGFSNNTPDGSKYSATQYASWNKSNYGFVATAGSTKINYDWKDSDHLIRGSIKELAFGNNISLDEPKERFKITTDLKISGLNITTQDVMNNVLGAPLKKITGLLDGDTSGMLKIIKAGAVVFNGSKGADTFTGFSKADKINGGAGNDTLKGEGGADTIKGGAGHDKIYGGSGADKLYGDAGNDTIRGGTGNDKVYGGSGNDKLYGEAGNDTLYGGAGKDTLSGGSGNDKLYGGTGNDTLSGGAGNDIFVFKKNEGNDRITDFDAGPGKGDVIHLDDALLKNFSAVLEHATDTSKGVLIDYGKGSILLSNVEKFDLHQNDFYFF